MDHQTMGAYMSDPWTAVHITGTALIYSLLMLKFDMPQIPAALLAFVLGVTWELCDAAYSSMRTGPGALDNVFDKRGADWRDICADGAGVIGVTLVLWL